MRRFCPVSSARFDQPPTHDFALDASGNRYAALQEMEDVVALRSDRDTVTEDDSKEDQEHGGGVGAPSLSKNNKMGPYRKGSFDLMESDPDDDEDDTKYNKNKKNNKTTHFSTSGWRQAVLPHGHAQLPTTANRVKTSSTNHERKVRPATTAAKGVNPQQKGTEAENSGGEGKLKPPPPVWTPERRHNNPACPMYGRPATGGVYCEPEPSVATCSGTEFSDFVVESNDNGDDGISLPDDDDPEAYDYDSNDEDHIAHEAKRSDENRQEGKKLRQAKVEDDDSDACKTLFEGSVLGDGEDDASTTSEPCDHGDPNGHTVEHACAVRVFTGLPQREWNKRKFHQFGERKRAYGYTRA